MNPGEPMQNLGALGGTASGAKAINNAGQVVGWAETAELFAAAFLKNPGQPMQNLDTLGGSSSVAYDINNAGQVVGQAHDGNFQKAFLWGMGYV